MNSTTIDFLLGSHVYLPFNDGSVDFSLLKGLVNTAQLFGGILLIVAYFYLWNKSGIRIWGQTYHEVFYTKPYVCVDYKSGVCDWCKVHDEREVHKLKQILYLFMAFPEDAGLVDKGYEDKGIQRAMVIQVVLIFILCAMCGYSQYLETDSVIKLSMNYNSLTSMEIFLIKLTNGVGIFFTLFFIFFFATVMGYQLLRVKEYSKKKYGLSPNEET